MFGDKSYSILLWSILGYLCIRKNVKEMNGYKQLVVVYTLFGEFDRRNC